MVGDSDILVGEKDDIFLKRFAPSATGLRVAIKDTFDQRGEVTACASRALATNPPADSNSDVVDALQQSNCAIVGRANMHELAYGVTGLNDWTGTPTNPFYPDLIPGGSSSGSAVSVAAGLVDFALGTDTGGSVRVPAACCGVVGLKPTFARISRRGLIPEQSSLDCIGPFAKSVDLIEQAMAIVDPSWKRADVVDTPIVGCIAVDGDAQIQSIVHEHASGFFDVRAAELPLFAEAMAAGVTIIGRECWNAFGHLVPTGLLGDDIAGRLRAASEITDEQVASAEAVRDSFAKNVDLALAHAEALILPTLPILPLRLADARDSRAAIPITANCRPFNLSGHPAISLPIAELNGAPVAMQLVGRRGEDERLCALARQVKIFERGEQR